MRSVTTGLEELQHLCGFHFVDLMSFVREKVLPILAMASLSFM